ncbi:MAG TPA: 16S rRNA (adenine(1518)-N(6)/adenine(1519)-N(6))-dimethyltransferase RsmA [Chloroflexia bacterium]
MKDEPGTESDNSVLSPQSSSLSYHRPRKSLGQHFLKDRSVPPRIAVAAAIEPNDVVVEVGPGLGVLTEELARRLDPERGRLVAVELDDDLLPVLRERFAAMPHVSFVHADVLDVPPQELSQGRPYKLVANLPYYITSAILRHFLETEHKPRSLTVMVQKEVADRMVAKPPEMSLLAVSVQFYGRPKIMFKVPPGAFNPPPKVDSAVVRIDVYGEGESPVDVSSEAAFFRLAQAGFGQRRKQLANTLTSGLGLPKSEVIESLQKAGIEPTRRAETLTLGEWARLERTVSELTRQP